MHQSGTFPCFTKFSSTEHIKKTPKKASSSINLLKRMRALLDSTTADVIFKAMTQPLRTNCPYFTSATNVCVYVFTVVQSCAAVNKQTNKPNARWEVDSYFMFPHFSQEYLRMNRSIVFIFTPQLFAHLKIKQHLSNI